MMRKLLAGLLFLVVYVSSTLAQPYAKGNWLVGPAIGDIALGGFESQIDSATTTTTLLTGVLGVKLQCHSGLFVAKKLNIGLLLDYNTYAEESQPDPDPTNMEITDGWGEILIGLYARYYMPIAERWAVYPEIAIGWGGYQSLSLVNSTAMAEQKTEVIARGFAANVTIGAGYFFSEQVSLDFSINYGLGQLTGERNVSGSNQQDITITLADVDFLIGATLFFGD